MWPKGRLILFPTPHSDYIILANVTSIEVNLTPTEMMVIRRCLILVLYFVFSTGWLIIAFAPSLPVLCIGDHYDHHDCKDHVDDDYDDYDDDDDNDLNEMILSGRGVTGFCSAAFGLVGPVFIGEIASPKVIMMRMTMITRMRMIMTMIMMVIMKTMMKSTLLHNYI